MYDLEHKKITKMLSAINYQLEYINIYRIYKFEDLSQKHL